MNKKPTKTTQLHTTQTFSFSLDFIWVVFFVEHDFINSLIHIFLWVFVCVALFFLGGKRIRAHAHARSEFSYFIILSFLVRLYCHLALWTLIFSLTIVLIYDSANDERCRYWFACNHSSSSSGIIIGNSGGGRDGNGCDSIVLNSRWLTRQSKIS